MTRLWRLFLVIFAEQRGVFLAALALTILVLAMGAALLGLSGWFITAAAAAGLAGTGAVFDVFRPSAMVRFLALGRAVARYGERVISHEATLRGLESLRTRLLAARLGASYAAMIRLRGAEMLNRLTSDIDALDGMTLRLILPLAGALATQLIALALLWWLTSAALALWVVGVFLVGSVLTLTRAARRAVPLSRLDAAAGQAFRSRLIDLIAARRDLAVYGALTAQAGRVREAEIRRLVWRRALDRIEQTSGAALSLTATLAASGALYIGLTLLESGALSPAEAALGFFAALGLAESIAPLRRAVTDLGRMADAARRVEHDLTLDTLPAVSGQPGSGLEITGLTLLRPGSETPILQNFSLTIAAGRSVAITGPSGSGKSTLLLTIAGLLAVTQGSIRLGGVEIADIEESRLRQVLTLVPQRCRLMAGSIADNLRLAAPDAGDELFWQALKAVALDDVIRARGGLESRLTARGEGLSGGEARRLVLARALLRRPDILLLDEPTEGLDEATASLVLHGIRSFLPNAVLLIAAHRQRETDFVHEIVSIF